MVRRSGGANAALLERVRTLEADVLAARTIVRRLLPFAEATAKGICNCAAMKHGGCLVCQARDFVREWKEATA